MEIRFGRDIVTFKHVIELKVNDEELVSMREDAQAIVNALENLKAREGDIEESTLIRFIRTLQASNWEVRETNCSYDSGLCACDNKPTCKAGRGRV